MYSQVPMTIESLDKFFLQNFEIKYRSPHEIKWEQRKIILLGEDHIDLVFRRQYSSLIDAMSKTHSIVVLVEGEKSMHVINKNASAQTCFISAEVAIYGWDTSTPKDRYPDLPQINECAQLFLKYELKLLETEAEIDVSHSNELKKEARQIFNNFNTIFEEFRAQKEPYMEAVKRNFPERTQSMIDTIKNVVNLHPQSTLFVIAGCMHVQQEIQEDSRLELSSLYKYLDTVESMTLIKKPREGCSIS